jgi:hypothetical protein
VGVTAMKEQKILEYLRELNKQNLVGPRTFYELLAMIMQEFKVTERLGRKVLVKYLDEEFEV